MALRKIPIYRSLTRPSLLIGAERELVLVTGMLAAMLIFAAQTVLGLSLGLLLWGIGVYLLRQMGKADPMMSRIYIRHVQYRAYYPAHSRPSRSGE